MTCYLLLTVFINYIIVYGRETTYDEELEDFYTIEHLKHGDNKTYHIDNKYTKIYYKGFIPATGEIFRFD